MISRWFHFFDKFFLLIDRYEQKTTMRRYDNVDNNNLEINPSHFLLFSLSPRLLNAYFFYQLIWYNASLLTIRCADEPNLEIIKRLSWFRVVSPCSHVHKRQPMCERITLAERAQQRNSLLFTFDLIINFYEYSQIPKKKKETGYNINIYKNFWCKFFK